MGWSHLIVIVLILLIVISESAAMASLKKSGLENGAPLGFGSGAEFWFLLGALMYILVAILLRQTFAYEKMGVVNGLWSALSVIATIIVGKVIYGESLKKMELIAIGLATIAAIILGK